MPQSHPPPVEPPATKVLCLGCGRAFSHFGRISHLAQTRNPPCCEIAAQERETQANSSPELSDTMFEETPAPDGDFFGAYNEDEMPWPSPGFRATHLDVDDEDDVLMDDPNGHNSSVANSQGIDDEDEDSEDDPDNEEEVLHEEGCNNVTVGEDRVFIETFPSQYGDAGIVMERGTGSLYKTYSNDHQDNMYAPFKSKLDWDFAQWAKLRGPGSTALNELLNIDGVSIICFKAAID
jgi:hypothetical protein